MKRIFLMILAACICIGMVACGTHAGESPSVSNPTTDAEMPVETPQVLEYLKLKYGQEFMYVGHSHDETTFHCTSTAGGQVVLVHKTSALRDEGIDTSLLDTQYADNGYLVFAQDEIEDYYQHYFAGQDVRVVVAMNTEFFPHNVSTNDSYEFNRNMYPGFFNPLLFVLCEKELDAGVVDNVKAAMLAANESLSVSFVEVPKKDWNKATVDSLVWNFEEYSTISQFTISEGAA